MKTTSKRGVLTVYAILHVIQNGHFTKHSPNTHFDIALSHTHRHILYQTDAQQQTELWTATAEQLVGSWRQWRQQCHLPAFMSTRSTTTTRLFIEYTHVSRHVAWISYFYRHSIMKPANPLSNWYLVRLKIRSYIFFIKNITNNMFYHCVIQGEI